jgi:hypothetical protein
MESMTHPFHNIVDEKQSLLVSDASVLARRNLGLFGESSRTIPRLTTLQKSIANRRKAVYSFTYPYGDVLEYLLDQLH